jgi:DNA-binding Lrp family transcriptional regulator
MGEDRLAMSQRERDRLKILHEVSRRQITQKQAAEHLKLSERQVRRLVTSLKQLGDVAVVHGLRGRASNRKTSGDLERRAIEELRREECRDFGPTFAAEHVSKVLGIKVGRDTIRKWLIAAGLWQSRKRKVETIHQWRERRACFGELVQWDTCIHDWLEGRGERLYLIAMIDDATSRVHARFVRHDTAEENMRVLWQWLERYGRPLAFYTDKAAMFETTPKSSHASEQEGMQPTQITRALTELGIERISAHSPQAKGRIERFFNTAQDRLVKQLRLAGACTLEAANACLETQFLPDWDERFTVSPANTADAHRSLTELHNLAATLSRVEMRTIATDYTIQFERKRYQIARASVRVAMKGQKVRVEARLDGSLAMRYEGAYLDISASISRQQEDKPAPTHQPVRKDHNRGGRSRWMRDYPVIAPKPIWQAIRESNRNS